ncbi:MAG TPA: hypothetical protein DCM28_17220 [Phycisphaerales bacterium]|nr:hypothetical protein [Phycisphaerales bacterium]|tara:strand:- start:23441 stop:26452 length:3012 start_codon:yes stop_codon:yes gene_type:complete
MGYGTPTPARSGDSRGETILNIHRHRDLNWILICVILFAGCQAYPARAQQIDPAVPPGLDARVVTPYSGNALQKASKPFDQILNDIKKPVFLPEDPVALQKSIDDQPQVEPPIVAMLSYVQARMAWEQKRLFEARQYLERSLTMAPNSKHLLQMLAQLWASTGNLSRSTAYLEKVLQVDPLNMDLVMQLGVFAMEQDRFTEAIAIFHYVQLHMKDAPEPDQGLLPLVDYYLGVALEREGYALASIKSFRSFMTSDIQQMPNDARQARRIELLTQQKGSLWRQLGDTYCQLQEYDQALESYRTAVMIGGNSKIDIIRRLVYVCLKLDKPQLAAQSTLEMLSDDPVEESTVQLIQFMVKHVKDRDQWVGLIQQQIAKHKTDASAMMLLVDLFEPAAAEQMVREHLKQSPGDEKAIAWMLDHLDPNASDGDLTQALDIVLNAMMHNPQRADVYSVMLVAKVKDQSALQEKIKALPENEKAKAIRLYLLAQSHSRSSQIQQARTLLEQALEVDDQLTVARLRLAVLHMAQKHFELADQTLKAIDDQTDTRVVNIRVQLLTQANRLDEVLAVLDKAIAARPENVQLILQKARVQVSMNKPAMAERTLLDALNMNPHAEAIYEALFEMYNENVVPDAIEQYKRLMMRVLKTIPNSRVARMRFADQLSASGENDRAEKMFLELLDENPKDYRALSELLDMYRRGQSPEKADQLLTQKMSELPNDRLLMLVAQTHYQQLGQKDKWFELTELIISQFDEEPIRTLRLGNLYMENQREKQGVQLLEQLWEKQELEKDLGLTLVTLLSRGYSKLKQPDAMDKLFETALKRYPEHDADLLYTWAQNLDRMGHNDRSEQIMLKLLAKHPDHGPANNGLGYAWANAGRNLDKALVMIQKAVESDPENAAYLDSLGWVYYKLGKFDLAVDKLTLARQAPGGDYPVILDHLGDAQYRKGDVADAIRTWQRAQHQMNQPENTISDDPELKGLADKLKAKITASSEEKEPPVADVNIPVQQ